MAKCFQHISRVYHNLQHAHIQLTTLTTIAIGLDTIAVLQPITPSSVVSSRCTVALANSVPTLKPMTPFSAIDPLSLGFNPKPVPLPLRPVTLICIPTWPGVDPYYLEPVWPGPGVFALALGSSADTVSVGFPILPAPAICASIVEVEPSAARHSE